MAVKKQFKVGVFVGVGILLAGIAVFAIGENRKMWDPQVKFEAPFGDVSGLKAGSPVRLGGVDIGTVESVAYSRDAKDPKIYVRLSIVRAEAPRVRTDTVAKVVNKGFLGDKMVELTVSSSGTALAPGARIPTEEPTDFNKYLAKFDAISDKAEKVVTNIEVATRPLGDPQFSEDLRHSMGALRAILDGVAHNKEGALHRFIFDAEEGRRVEKAIANVQGATDNLNAALADVRDVTGQIRRGPGIAHAILYDGEMSRNAAGAVAEVHKDLQAIRQGNGVAHALLYGDDQTQHVMGNLNAMSDDLRHIVAGMRAGKGTIGGLLVDPSIYEDVKTIVGNVDRNQVLRALVRYSIKADEGKPRVESARSGSPPNP